MRYDARNYRTIRAAHKASKTVHETPATIIDDESFGSKEDGRIIEVGGPYSSFVRNDHSMNFPLHQACLQIVKRVIGHYQRIPCQVESYPGIRALGDVLVVLDIRVEAMSSSGFGYDFGFLPCTISEPNDHYLNFDYDDWPGPDVGVGICPLPSVALACADSQVFSRRADRNSLPY